MKLFFYYTIVLICTTIPFMVQSQSADASLNNLVEKYYDDYLMYNPLEATSIGIEKYNDTFVLDFTDDYIKSYKAFLENNLTELNKIDQSALSAKSNITYECFKSNLNKTLKSLTFPRNLMPFDQFNGVHLFFGQLASGSGIQPFRNYQDYLNFNERMKLYAKYIEVSINYFKKGVITKVTLPKAVVTKLIDQFKSLTPTDFRKSVYYQAVKKYPKGLSKSQKKQIENKYSYTINKLIYSAHKKMITFLEKEYLKAARTTSGWNDLPNGDEWYMFNVYYWTTTQTPPQQIYELGLKEVERIKKEMNAVKEQVNFNGSLDEFFEHIKKDTAMYPFKTPEEVLTFFNAIRSKIEPQMPNYFGAFPKTPFEIRRTEAFREMSASAEYNQGSPDGSRPGIFYIPIPDAKQFNMTSGTESLFLHEAIPGHHYQISLQQENTDLPRFRKFSWVGAYGEGWALYCESLGKELGLYTDPYQYFGALGDEIHRAIRLVVDVAIHTGKMTREEAIKYMMDNEPINEQGATAEIERYMVMPAQALSYKIGALKIQSLRAKYTEQLGDKFHIASFHDEVLKDGCVPLDVLEKKMEIWAKGLSTKDRASSTQ